MLSWTPERWQKASSILDEALERPAEERRSFVEAQCEDDELRDEILAMLALEASDHTLLDQGALETAAPLVDGEETDRLGPDSEASTVGRYRLKERLGRGGMGIVYLAERADGQYTQDVALKLLTRASSEAVQRFRTERQILAALDHPNVARLLDGGTTAGTPSQPDGVPFLVMEHVKGVPITDYCVHNRLSFKERLELMIEVAEAVQHAHRKLVIHRDLKPSNILVTETDDGTPTVKLLDFGIAKMLDEGALSAQMDVVSTQTGLALLTPAYAAPEQVAGQPCDATTDVYQLGVVLYEMLTGQLPFDLDDASPSKATKVILNDRPLPPSQRAAYDTSSTSTRALGRIRSDLDTLVMKAIRKEPGRRYGSPDALAADLRRYLDNLPLAARPDSTTYRIRLFARRNRGGVAVAAILVCLLVLFGARERVLRSEAEAARSVAEQERDRAEEVTNFIVNVLNTSDPWNQEHAAGPGGEDVTVREAVSRAHERIASDLSAQPLRQARVLIALAEIYDGLDEKDRAVTAAHEAYTLANRHADVGSDVHNWARLAYADALSNTNHGADSLDAAEDEYTSLIADLEDRVTPPDIHLALARHNLGFLYTNRLQRHADADSLYSLALPSLRALRDRYPEEFGAALDNKSRALSNIGEVDGAYRYSLEALRSDSARLGWDHPRTAGVAANLAGVVAARGDSASALRLHKHGYETLESSLGPLHEETLSALNNLANYQQAYGRLEDADRLFQVYLERIGERYSPQSSGYGSAYQNYAVLQKDLGDIDGAIQSLKTAREAYQTALPAGHPYRVFPLATTADIYNESGRHEEAETAIRVVLDTFYTSLPEGHSGTIQAEQILLDALLGQRKYEPIEPMLKDHYRYTSENGPSTAYRSSVNWYVRTFYEQTERPVPEVFAPAMETGR